ncbi:hypothetical protein LENED_002817 [Lentinula edodes]|uniref:Integrase core domain-containing protein n=1 Tax=Lentinula edodes TaxID=5353 RepID=A0A1Q3E1Z1_LENED|nr:hypothetical protein LENED_002817 [Lentinula edodes]
MSAVRTFGWPSRCRGDWGTENNEVERLMVSHWGEHHRAYLRGRLTHNVRIERAWRDVRKDSLEVFRKIFQYLVDIGLLDSENSIQSLCLYVVYRNRIQASLDRTLSAWNNHQLRTEHHKTPIAIYELSREKAINQGYWTGDPGDDVRTASHPFYGQEDGDLPPLDELANDPTQPNYTPYNSKDEEKADGIFVNDDDEIQDVKDFLVAEGFDYDREDGNWGIDVYCEAVMKIQQLLV